ncbi:MAG TPA: putative metalloprotease CJM1_0395 family protein [Candidatus Paceibacterota bacterium]|nr:putative metalloprotease CJM1_0395 family protein [Verrucomicrobiota bacterium]HRY51600.1 putative metalloprotease CJM1_0395 family protein [Candidatus Paceibacterota bacterium]
MEVCPVTPATRYARHSSSRSDRFFPYKKAEISSQDQEETVSQADPKKTDDTAETAEIQRLAEKDRAVRSHEAAHMAAGGQWVRGGPKFTYQRGPDGKQYAVGGEVRLDTSVGRTPEETAAKARQIRAAALAPSDPSSRDMAVAAQAAAMEIAALQAIRTSPAVRSSSPAPRIPEGIMAYTRSVQSSPPALWELA